MKTYLYALVVGSSLILGQAQAQAAAVNTKTVTIALVGKGITAITPASCSFVGGTGSANTAVCQFIATTIPAGQAVTWGISGTDAAKFVITSAGALSVGATDVGVGNFSITVTATGN